MVDYRIERIPESKFDGEVMDIGYKLFMILKDGTEKQVLYGNIDSLFKYIADIHGACIGTKID